ncbi:hypothetical protein SAMN00120144_3534 [Hymenobacter roseosalivarius DSM 11622]|uniref:Uncharacterized protein n=1 Tax=Hymenobacter roseosalivarius DSM 11622 TaxID=645990 RepID=A0A1W1VIZ0_9BACT|nr:hypothetical protein SAMN00120144_3534 [Hymenobacter roseosalivarius DSM 11622]
MQRSAKHLANGNLIKKAVILSLSKHLYRFVVTILITNQ